MKKILFFGECMVELRFSDNGKMSQSFAGDTYNSAVYLKRCFPGISTGFLTAMGQDSLSSKMIDSAKLEGIDTSTVFLHPEKAPGIYLIDTDETGERSFTYWRNDSAAKCSMDFVKEQTIESITQLDMFFFSGISIAILSKESQEKFWKTLERLKSAGVKIAFDPNYRAKLWNSRNEAIDNFDKAVSFSDIVLPGVEDFQELYGLHQASEIIEHCKALGANEIIVKNGPDSISSLSDGMLQEHKISPIKNIVDTTSAGDAFNGVYIGSRLEDNSVVDAINLASMAAGAVIQHRGAIISKHDFLSSLNKSKLDNGGNTHV